MRWNAGEARALLAGIAAFLTLFAGGSLLMRVARLPAQPTLVARADPPGGAAYYLGYSRGGVDEYALYHDLDGAAAAVRRADVLFLGSSRAMFALPRETLAPFFARRGLRFYVLAFGYNESNVLPEAIIRRYDLRPRLVIVNADPFFTDEPSAFARRVLSETAFDARKFRFETVAADEVRRRLHRLVPYFEIAGPNRDWVWFRSREDGTTHVAAADGVPSRVRPSAELPGADARLVATASRFRDEMAARGAAIVLTAVPPRASGAAEGIASTLGVPFLDPPLRRLRTLDGSHLDLPSARAYSEALLAELEPLLPAPR